jgi:hypothetical protein
VSNHVTSFAPPRVPFFEIMEQWELFHVALWWVSSWWLVACCLRSAAIWARISAKKLLVERHDWDQVVERLRVVWPKDGVDPDQIVCSVLVTRTTYSGPSKLVVDEGTTVS